jgi:hypothetical protein
MCDYSSNAMSMCAHYNTMYVIHSLQYHANVFTVTLKCHVQKQCPLTKHKRKIHALIKSCQTPSIARQKKKKKTTSSSCPANPTEKSVKRSPSPPPPQESIKWNNNNRWIKKKTQRGFPFFCYAKFQLYACLFAGWVSPAIHACSSLCWVMSWPRLACPPLPKYVLCPSGWSCHHVLLILFLFFFLFFLSHVRGPAYVPYDSTLSSSSSSFHLRIAHAVLQLSMGKLTGLGGGGAGGA